MNLIREWKLYKKQVLSPYLDFIGKDDVARECQDAFMAGAATILEELHTYADKDLRKTIRRQWRVLARFTQRIAREARIRQ